MIYFLQFNLTKNCNKKCYYCDVYRDNKEVEVDIDFVKYILKRYGLDLMVEFCGGEPGMVTNLDEVFVECYDAKHVKKIQVMSNGLVRKRDFDWLKFVQYNEHLIFEVDGKKVKKHYDMWFEFRPHIKNVIVMTEKTVKSFLEHWDWYKGLGYFNKKLFWHKMMNPKTFDISGYADELNMFYDKLGDKWHVEMIKSHLGLRNDIAAKKLCSHNSPQPAIDFETKEIVHCAVNLMKCKRFPVTDYNIERHLKEKLFSYEGDTCGKCYVFRDVETSTKMMVKREPVNRL
jgi:organic radical activating enzyme